LCLHLRCGLSTRGLRRLLLLLGLLLLLRLLLLRLPLGWLLLLRLGRLRVLLCLTLAFGNRDLRLTPHLGRGRLLCGRLAILRRTLM